MTKAERVKESVDTFKEGMKGGQRVIASLFKGIRSVSPYRILTVDEVIDKITSYEFDSEEEKKPEE